MPRYVGIDHGSRRVGLAISDGGGSFASPLAMVEVRGRAEEHVATILAALADFDFDEIVVGLPLNMDGTEGDQARTCRRFGERLGAAAAKPVHFHDERLSTFSARESLRDSALGRKKQKARLDSLAARDILQQFLDGRR